MNENDLGTRALAGVPAGVGQLIGRHRMSYSFGTQTKKEYGKREDGNGEGRLGDR